LCCEDWRLFWRLLMFICLNIRFVCFLIQSTNLFRNIVRYHFLYSRNIRILILQKNKIYENWPEKNNKINFEICCDKLIMITKRNEFLRLSINNSLSWKTCINQNIFKLVIQCMLCNYSCQIVCIHRHWGKFSLHIFFPAYHIVQFSGVIVITDVIFTEFEKYN
jgi:hypothetical protein